MERRTYLRTLGVAGIASTAGCLEDTLGLGSEDDGTASEGEDGETILEAPDRRGDPSHPVHGDAFPSFSVPDPLTDETVSLEDFVGERPFVMTFFFTTCPDGACPALLLRLRRVQEDAAERGYSDDVGLVAMTFDPERDTPEVIEEYAGQQGVDLEAGNWNFLRPESYEEARELVEDRIGMPFERVDDPDEADHDSADGEDEQHGDGNHGGDGNESNHGDENHDGDGNESDHGDHDHGEYTFVHYNLIVLVNEQGIVERAYPRAVHPEEGVDVETIVEDTRTVVDG